MSKFFLNEVIYSSQSIKFLGQNLAPACVSQAKIILPIGLFGDGYKSFGCHG